MTQGKDNNGVSAIEQKSEENGGGFKQFRGLRVVAGVIFAGIILWGFWFLLGFFGGSDKAHEIMPVEDEPVHGIEKTEGFPHGGIKETEDFPLSGIEDSRSIEDGHLLGKHDTKTQADDLDKHDVTLGQGGLHQPKMLPEHEILSERGSSHQPKALGVHFVEATILVLNYELHERFWGWRCNDLIRLTDNVENMQLGTLEVVRRASVVLMERISRHGPSAMIEASLQNAMNWLMIKPEKYWLPSAEEEYSDSLKELRAYAHKLEKGEAHFYNRTDNLIPLLISFADLAGSCDENLVKAEEDDGSPVSWFMVDDYFYYAKGIARAMEKILHGVREDFSSISETRHGVDLLHRAIHACHVAAELDPWLVTNASLDGILANHRANMAAEISHVRYFLNALAKALST